LSEELPALIAIIFDIFLNSSFRFYTKKVFIDNIVCNSTNFNIPSSFYAPFNHLFKYDISKKTA
jgi:hypothetical protein